MTLAQPLNAASTAGFLSCPIPSGFFAISLSQLWRNGGFMSAPSGPVQSGSQMGSQVIRPSGFNAIPSRFSKYLWVSSRALSRMPSGV